MKESLSYPSLLHDNQRAIFTAAARATEAAAYLSDQGGWEEVPEEAQDEGEEP